MRAAPRGREFGVVTHTGVGRSVGPGRGAPNDQAMCRSREFCGDREQAVCQDRAEGGQFVKVSAHCPIAITWELTVLAHGLIAIAR
jgi:hypothetical protein